MDATPAACRQYEKLVDRQSCSKERHNCNPGDCNKRGVAYGFSETEAAFSNAAPLIVQPASICKLLGCCSRKQSLNNTGKCRE